MVPLRTLADTELTATEFLSADINMIHVLELKHQLTFSTTGLSVLLVKLTVCLQTQDDKGQHVSLPPIWFEARENGKCPSLEEVVRELSIWFLYINKKLLPYVSNKPLSSNYLACPTLKRLF